MAVVVQYVVERKGVETLTTKNQKEANAYDKMLDVAENLSDFLGDSELDLSEKALEDIGIALSKNKDIVTKILKGSTYSDLTNQVPAK